MKIRTGFVSNSSSSSFLIYGVAVTDRDLPAEVLPRDKDGDPVEVEGVDPYELWYDFAGNNKLDHWHPSYDITHYIGLSWDRVKDDETGKQFRERAEALIEKAFGKKMKLTTLKEAWRDG